jgi:hypothetical protein
MIDRRRRLPGLAAVGAGVADVADSSFIFSPPIVRSRLAAAGSARSQQPGMLDWRLGSDFGPTSSPIFELIVEMNSGILVVFGV